jgi:hypothetical protein
MERNDWNNRNRNWSEDNRRDHFRKEDNRPVNEDSYRGAYRFDNTSDHHNVSTWNGYGSTEGHRNRNDNTSIHHNDRGYDSDNYNRDSRYRDQDIGYRSSNSANWNQQPRLNQRDKDNQNRNYHSSNYESVHDRIVDHDPYGAGNFSANYGPDHYRHREGENYGNMAGSLSYGYDGSSNYDPDWNSMYDPQTGHRRSYHGYYTSRHPEPRQYREDHDRDKFNR